MKVIKKRHKPEKEDATVEDGIQAIESGDTLAGLLHFECRPDRYDNPIILSYLAYCTAAEHKKLKEALDMCETAIQREPSNAVHYLNKGRILLLAGLREKAIKAFRKGLRQACNHHIITALEQLGLRKPPPFSRLPRKHPLNKYAGMFLSRLGMR